MLLLILLIVICACLADVQKAYLTKEQSAKVREYSVDCIKQSEVNPEVIAKARYGHFTEDEGLKKFTLCFFQKTGILNDEGELDEDVVLSKFPPQVDKAAIRKVLEDCKTIAGKNTADIAYKIFKCCYKNTPTHIRF